VVASLLELLEAPELIVESYEDYVQKVVNLAKDPIVLSQIKEKISYNIQFGPLFDTKRYTNYLESAYVTMFKHHQLGLKPDHFTVDKI